MRSPTIVVCLVLALVSNSQQQLDPKLKYTRCDQLPRQPFRFETLTGISSPFTVLYTNGPASNCTRELYSAAARGRNDYSGIVTILSGPFAILLKLTVAADNKTVYTINCNDNGELKWWIMASNYNGVDGYFCPYVCTSDGKSFDQFACKGLSGRVNPQITNNILPGVKNIPGADKIYFSQANCPPTKNCNLFS